MKNNHKKGHAQTEQLYCGAIVPTDVISIFSFPTKPFVRYTPASGLSIIRGVKFLFSFSTYMDTSITHIRPRFKFNVNSSSTEVMEHIRTLLAETPNHITGKIIGDHVILDITGEDVHYWSPQLNFRVEEDEDTSGKTLVAGLIGPRPSVWTLFMFLYFSIGLAGFFYHVLWHLPVHGGGAFSCCMGPAVGSARYAHRLPRRANSENALVPIR